MPKTRVRKIRRSAVQDRSRATVERILRAAIALVIEKGAERVTMSEIANRADVVIGALYQYFADKRAILKAILARHNADVEAMLNEALADVRSMEDFLAAIETVSRDYFHLHRTDPLFRSIWSAVQIDAELQALDVEDSLAKGRLAFAIAEPLYGSVDKTELLAACTLVMQMALTAARHSLVVPKLLARHTLTLYQRMCRSLFLSLERDARYPQSGEVR